MVKFPATEPDSNLNKNRSWFTRTNLSRRDKIAVEIAINIALKITCMNGCFNE